ncbi:serine/threonine protein kinase [Streptomyces avidinii]|uniref:serine/threonine-protein kinase n=1 Tax=Streptomyces avidinii TaxID=1895 RepID=UPI00386F4ADB|nr:serine/threonine protein kinase [Streptomyces avidinii]WTB02151.1 serine/threonine protein kinase [Streptomyces avidinii]
MDALTPEDPTHIGPYRLIGLLGAGGMGRVYLARSMGGRTVAVKAVRETLAQQDEFRWRFAREVEAARSVGGSWTAPVLDADTQADTPWVAIGYVPGPDLHTVVVGDEYGPLPEESVLALANGLAHALADIHVAGLVHRDIKPSNVLLTVDGPRVIDFGIARALETPVDGVRTRTGVVIGSPGFMSPEQVRGEKPGPASDVFCLGSVLMYAATGRTPFGELGSGAHALMFRIAEEAADLEGLSDPLYGLVRDCLAKDPARRPSTGDLLERTSQWDLTARPDWLPGKLLASLGSSAGRLLDADGPSARTHLIPPAQAVLPPPDAPSAKRPRRAIRRPRLLVLATALALTAVTVVLLPHLFGGGDGADGNNDKDEPGRALPRNSSAFVGNWAGVVEAQPGGPMQFLRMRIGPGNASGNSGTYSFLRGQHLCRGTIGPVPVSGDQMVVKGENLKQAEVFADRPEDEALACRPPETQTLTRKGDELHLQVGVWSAILRDEGDEPTPRAVSEKYTGAWTSEGLSPNFHLRIEEVELDSVIRITAGTSPNECYVTGRLFAIEEGSLSAGLIEGETVAQGACAGFGSFTLRSTGKDTMDVKAEGNSGPFGFRRTKR